MMLEGLISAVGKEKVEEYKRCGSAVGVMRAFSAFILFF